MSKRKLKPTAFPQKLKKTQSTRYVKFNLDFFLERLSALGVELPKAECRFCKRKWKIDFAWPDIKLAIEQEGGIFIYGRHNSPRGFISDMEKYNRLAALGWILQRFTPQQLMHEEYIKEIASLYFTLKELGHVPYAFDDDSFISFIDLESGEGRARLQPGRRKPSNKKRIPHSRRSDKETPSDK